MIQYNQDEVELKRDDLIYCAILQCRDEEFSLYEEFLEELEDEVCQRFQSVIEDYYDFKADDLIEGYQTFINNICYAPAVEVEKIHARVFGN